MGRLLIVVLCALFVVVGCGKPTEDGHQHHASSSGIAQAADTTKPAVSTADNSDEFSSFSIYADKGSRDNHFIPSGFMPDGKCLVFDDGWMQDCHSGKSCIRISYDVECSKQNQKWVGVYWQNPANNWGNRKGGFDLTGAEKVTFWAKGEKGGERIEEFKIGGLTGDYPDSDMAMIGPVVLSSEWKQYTIDLRGKDLSYISGGFSWATNVDVNPQGCLFYLDDLRYE